MAIGGEEGEEGDDDEEVQPALQDPIIDKIEDAVNVRVAPYRKKMIFLAKFQLCY